MSRRLILGLDIATLTGFAWYEPGSSLSSIKTGLIKAVGENAEEKAESLGRQLRDMIKGNRPDFVAIEQPMRNVVSFKKTRQTLTGPVDEQTINPNALQLEGLVCAAVAIIGGGYGIPWETIPSSTWRSCFLGFGRRPGFDRAAWKKAAVDRCRLLKVDVRNSDAAEAVGIAFSAVNTQRYKMLLVGKAA
ncbi:hypothetical protein [Mesorhizobium sp.]|uniref:hypothetical protein n=1 Tax=Mesorhizobium sp. TaxID=1871066 RepID=UPI0012173A5C|nr:hypothetical protein [Mesorhizobium sp.]TIN80726.1 MAG: hypothetical protein E5Y09_02570 [Mesorhizobium sp.]